MKKRKVTDRNRAPDVTAIDRDIKVAALLTTAAIVTEEESASFFLGALADSIVAAFPPAAQSGATKLVKQDATAILELLYGKEQPRKRRAKV